MIAKTKKVLTLKELIAIAIGGMVGGGIFTILGISAKMVGFLAPFAIALGGVVAFFAGYSYVKLGVYYKDEGATYSFFKLTYPSSHMAASFIGWYTIFGYISTLALYAYTFSSYSISGFAFANDEWIRKTIAIAIVWIFAFVNVWSVKGMGEIEDIMVYIKLAILFSISFILIYFSKSDLDSFSKLLEKDFENSSFSNILIVSSITFVAYEGFQLVINAVKEMKDPNHNIPRAIYGAIVIVALIYFVVALGSVWSIPINDLAKYQEYALAYGAKKIIGRYGEILVIVGAILATSSAINGTIFGSSRQMAKIADDGYMPSSLTKRKDFIPVNAILSMALFASLLILSGGLKVILEFGSITFLLVSLLMAVANFKIRYKTGSSTLMTLISISGLMLGAILILYYELKTNPKQLFFILIIYIILSIGAFAFANIRQKLQ